MSLTAIPHLKKQRVANSTLYSKYLSTPTFSNSQVFPYSLHNPNQVIAKKNSKIPYSVAVSKSKIYIIENSLDPPFGSSKLHFQQFNENSNKMIINLFREIVIIILLHCYYPKLRKNKKTISYSPCMITRCFLENLDVMR
jgi:hypothetical protein